MLNPNDKVLNRHEEAQCNDTKAKKKGRGYVNNARQVKPSKLKVGDKVLLKQPRKKITTKFETTPYTIIGIKGTQIVAENRQHQVRKEASFFKEFKSGEEETQDEDYGTKNVEPPERANERRVEEPVLRRSSRRRKQREHYRNSINSDLLF